MGTGSLKRIAAHTSLATIAVLGGGAMSAPAQLTVPTVGTTGTSVTVPSTTVRVPSTTTTVTTPSVTVKPPPTHKVSTPKVSTPKVSTPKVSTPKVKTPKATTPKVSAPNVGSKPSGPVNKVVTQAPKQIKQTTGKVISSPSGGGGGSSGSTLVGGTVGSVTGTLGTSGGTVGGTVRQIGGSTGLVGSGASGGLITGTNGSNTPIGGATFFGPGGPGGGPGGFYGGSGGGFLGGPGGSAGGGGGPTLAAMLAGASSLELRSVLEDLDGCLPALPSLERRVLSMRAGLGGTAYSRKGVASRLGMSTRGVRRIERRGLNRLQFAAVNTGCAAAVVGPFDPAGIGNLTAQLLVAGAVPVGVKDAVGDYGSRGFQARSAGPLFDLGGGGGDGGPAWAIILFTVLFSVSLAALTRELRGSF